MNAKHLCQFFFQIGFYKHGLLHMHFVAEPTIRIGGKSNILTRHLHFDINWYSYLRMARKLQAILQEFIGKFLLKFYQDLFLLSFLCSTTLSKFCLDVFLTEFSTFSFLSLFSGWYFYFIFCVASFSFISFLFNFVR